MLEYPKNYEEAKRIIINSVGDEYERHYLKSIKLKAAFVTAIGVATGIVTGLITGNITHTLGILPISGLLGGATLLPILGNKVASSNIYNETFFRKYSEEQIMELANKYVKDYNEFEKKNNNENIKKL